MPLVMSKGWARAWLCRSSTRQQRSGRQRVLPLVVNPTPCQRTMPMVLRKMLMVAHLKPLVLRLVMRPRQTKRGKSTMLKPLLNTWGGLGPCVCFQKRPCEKF